VRFVDGRAFLDSVRLLLTVPSEANRRSAAGPLYCALLNEARDALERWGYPVPARADVPSFVLAPLATVPNMDLVRVADPLEQCEHFRELADDSRTRLTIFDDDGEAKRLLLLAVIAIDVLDQIESDTARRAAVIADLRKVFP
jgi:hypothetical protein